MSKIPANPDRNPTYEEVESGQIPDDHPWRSPDWNWTKARLEPPRDSKEEHE